MRSYFQLVNSFMGHIYFKVSQHLHKPVTWVIRNKFHPDVKFLIMKYSLMTRQEQEEAQKLKDETEANNV
jgi:hypothetical protein